MKSAGAVEVVCEKHSISRGRIAGGDFSWRAHGCVIARRPRGSNLMHLQLPALIQQEDLDILDRQKVAARVPRSEQPQSTKVNLTNCLKMRTWLRQAPPCPGVEVCSLQSGGLFPYTQLGRSFPPQPSAVLQRKPLRPPCYTNHGVKIWHASAGAVLIVCEKRCSSGGKSQDAILAGARTDA